jgi:FkbM family methyltransferase
MPHIISYAQNREDVMLWRVLHAESPGFYIDVGAHDPVIDSVTQGFYDRGWRGINIEPQKQYYEKLSEARSGDINLNVAVSNEPGQLTFYRIADGDGLSTLDKTVAEYHRSKGMQVEASPVSVETLEAICDKHAKQAIHFLKIDVEGLELQVIQGLAFKQYRPWIILVEAVAPGSLTPSHQEWEGHLLSQDYQFVYFDGLNRFYLANEKSSLKHHFDAPINLFDHYETLAQHKQANELVEMRHELYGLRAEQKLFEQAARWKRVFCRMLLLPEKLGRNIVRLFFRRKLRKK